MLLVGVVLEDEPVVLVGEQKALAAAAGAHDAHIEPDRRLAPQPSPRKRVVTVGSFVLEGGVS